MDKPHLDSAINSTISHATTKVLVGTHSVPRVLAEVTKCLDATGAFVFDVDPAGQLWVRASTSRSQPGRRPIPSAATTALTTLTMSRPTPESPTGPMCVYPVVEAGVQVGGLVVTFPTEPDRQQAPDTSLSAFAAACDRSLRQSDRLRDEAHQRESDRLVRVVADHLVGDHSADLSKVEAQLGELGTHLDLDGLVLVTFNDGIDKLAEWTADHVHAPSLQALATADIDFFDHTMAAPSHWHSDNPAPDGSLGALFGQETCGEVVTVGGHHKALAAVIVVTDEVPLSPALRNRMERLARIVRNFVLRKELDRGISRRAQLDELRRRATELFLSNQQLNPDGVVRDVLEKTAIAFEADEILWAYRSSTADPLVACRYRRHDMLFDVFDTHRPHAMITPREPGVDLMHSRLDDAALERLGIDRERYPAPEITLAAIERSSEASSALVLLDYEAKGGRSDADHEAVIDLNRLFRQYHKGRSERQVAARDRRYEELRLAVADHLLRTSADTVGEIADAAMTMIGHALGADYVGFQRAMSNPFPDLVPWTTPRGRELLDDLLRLDDATFVQTDFFEVMSAGRMDVISMSDIPERSQALLKQAGADDVYVTGAVVQQGDPGTALVAVRFSRTGWGSSERALLSSLGTQLQLSIDAMKDRQDRRQRSEMDDLVARVASTLVDEPDFDLALSTVISDLVSSIGGVAAHWVIIGRQGISPFIRAAQRPQDETVSPLVEHSFDHWRFTWENITAASFHDGDSPLVRALKRSFPDSRVHPRVVIPIRDSEGVYSAWLDVAVTDEPAPQVVNALVSIARLIHEVGERRNADQMLITSFESAPTGQMLIDHAGVVRAANGAIRDRFGDLKGSAWTETDPDFVPGGPEREIALHMGNRSIWARVRSAVIDPNRQHPMTVVHVEDVTARRLARANLQHEATHDQLTGLGNRRLLDQRVQALSKRGGSSLVLLDVDRFKVVNDSLGHSAGDHVLNTLARRLERACRSTDVVCRFGGDEFAILLAGHHERHELEQFAEEVLTSLRAPIDVHGMPLRMTCSLGITSVPRGADADTLLRQSDLALHDAKASGRDNYRFFEIGSGESFHERLTMETAMRSGLDRGDFIPHFQPEYDLRTGEVLSLEALVRWNRGNEIIPAHDFIDIAEEVGLAPTMSQLVLEETCARAREWQRLGADVRVRVNVTAAQLRSGYLDTEVLSALERHDLAPQRLGLEVTERSLLLDVEATVATLTRLQAAGIEISIDDFGTGFSSLAWLKRLPIDTLKIDRSFVLNIAEDNADREIAKTIVGLARALDLDVVAEGVERQAQADVLLDLGCSRAQGWLWSPAVDAAAVPSLVSDARRSAVSEAAVH